jgi:hypothetical protein
MYNVTVRPKSFLQVSVWVIHWIVGSESESELLYDSWFTADQFISATSPLRLMTSNSIFQLSTCSYSPYVPSSMTRWCVCRLQLLLVLASAVILRSESRGTHDHILLSQIRDSLNLQGQVPVFISPWNRMARLYPKALGSLFVASWLAELRWRYSTPPPYGCRIWGSHHGGYREVLSSGIYSRVIRWKCTLLTICFQAHFLLWLILRPWRWRQHVPMKRLLIVNGLHGVISQKT